MPRARAQLTKREHFYRAFDRNDSHLLQPACDSVDIRYMFEIGHKNKRASMRIGPNLAFLLSGTAGCPGLTLAVSAERCPRGRALRASIVKSLGMVTESAR